MCDYETIHQVIVVVGFLFVLVYLPWRMLK